MITSHLLSRESCDALFSGAPDAAALSVINASQRSKHLLLLRMVVDRLPGGLGSNGLAGDALALLDHVRERNRPIFDQLISYPYVAAGLVWCDRRLRAGDDPGPVGGYLATVAAATAIAAREDFAFDRVPVGTAVHLPGLGTCRLTSTGDSARLAGRSGDVTLAGVSLPADLSRSSDAWNPVRPIAGAPGGFAPAFDDLDPHRGSGMPVAPYAKPDEFADWAGVFAAATERLADSHATRAAQVSTVMRTLTPLLSERPGQGRSASAWQAYGAIAVTLPRDAVNFAATLVHETQHSIFNGLLDLFEIYDPADSALYYSPWRADPRPLRGIFHGCFAFVGVADFWSRECAAGVGGPRARYEFARTCLQVRRALDTLDGSDALTSDGRHLVAQMSKYLDGVDGALPSGPSQHLAGLAAEDHRLSWRLRIVIPEADTVATAATAWREGKPAPALPGGSTLATGSETFVPSTRIRHFGRVAGNESTTADGPVPPADAHLAAREHLAAASGYRAAIQSGDGDQLAAWTGLALAGAQIGGPASQVWIRFPELVRAVHRELADSPGEPADPLELAGWLAEALSA